MRDCEDEEGLQSPLEALIMDMEFDRGKTWKFCYIRLWSF